MAKEIRLAHDRGHQEQMREILDLAGERQFDVHWYPAPGGHAHGGVVHAPDEVADAWAAREAERRVQLEREAAAAEEEPEFESDEGAEPEQTEPEQTEPEQTEPEGAEVDQQPEAMPERSGRSGRRGQGGKAAPEGDGGNA